jgi:hypothetical protein
MTYFMSDKSELSEKMDKCDSIVKELENLMKTLDIPSQFLETVEKTMRLESNRLIGKMTEDYEQIEQMRSQFEISVSIDKNTSQAIQNLLSESVYLGQSDRTKESRNTNINKFIKESPRRNNNDFQDTESRHSYSRKGNSREKDRDDDKSVRSNNFSRRELGDNTSERRSQRSRSAERPKRSINVIGLNTFKEESKRKYLHFFQNDDNYLHLLDLSSPGNQF